MRDLDLSISSRDRPSMLMMTSVGCILIIYPSKRSELTMFDPLKRRMLSKARDPLRSGQVGLFYNEY